MKTLYTAEAVVEGGRQGHGRTSDGRLDVDLSVPVEISGAGGPGTNPEQLFAVGYAACFQSTLMGVARGRKLDASDSRITSRVGIGPSGHGGFTLGVSLDLHAPHLSRAEAAELMARAHERCPYSNATRGNIEVKLSVDGVSLETQQAIISERNGGAESSAIATTMGPATQATGTD
jgi:Ohr subfamily peroxiredoxin